MNTRRFAMFVSLSTILATFSANAQTVCRESQSACNGLPGMSGVYSATPTADAASRTPCDPNDLSHATTVSSCDGSLVRNGAIVVNPTNPPPPVTVPTTVLPNVNLPSGGQVTVTAPVVPTQVINRVITRDGVARREAARANAGVTAISGTLGQIFGEGGPVAQAFQAEAEALAEEVRRRRAADEAEAQARAAADLAERQAREAADTAERNRATAAEQHAEQHAATADQHATDANATAQRALHTDRPEIALTGIFSRNVGTGHNLGAVGLCAAWVHTWTSVATRFGGCYSPGLAVVSGSPAPFLHVGHVTAGIIGLPRSRFQPTFALTGTMATSDIGSHWWNIGAEAGLRGMMTDPMEVGHAFGFELTAIGGYGVTHALGDNNQGEHGAGAVFGGRLSLFWQFQ